MSRFVLAAVLAPSFLLAALPLSAQAPEPLPSASGDEKVNMIIVYGDDACPQGKADEITVCARKSEAERYRIPEPLRGSSSPANDSWNNKVLAYERVGRSGTMSCSPVGGGGVYGCTQKLIDQAYAEKGDDPSIRFGQLIQAEREKRLSTIDSEATDTQKRVEEEERKYDERKAAEKSGQAPAQPPAPATAPASGQ